MGQGKKEEAEAKKAEVAAGAKRLAELEASETELQEKITKIMMVIPNIIDESVPIGKDDSQNVEIEKFGEPIVPDFEVPYHADILDRLNGLDKESAGRTSGNGFYYLMGDAARNPFRNDQLRKRLHDRQGIHLLHPSFHDPQQRSKRCYELRRNGSYDV